MRSWPETYAKDVLSTIFDIRDSVIIMEHSIVEMGLRADMYVVPGLAKGGQEDLGIVDRMLDMGTFLVEIFSTTPSSQAGFDCLPRQQGQHRAMRRRARREQDPAPPRPHLWIFSPGRPHNLIAGMVMKPMDGWPTGFWHIGGEFCVHLIIIRDLPEVPDTLLLRLLDRGERYERALAELDAMPEDSQLRKHMVEIMVAWRDEMFKTGQELEDDEMFLPETKARYAAWEKRVRGEGLKEGLKEGKEKGRREGEQAILRKLLTLRFGTLPEDAERHIKRASLAKLELWAERVLTANSLASVFAD